MNLFCFVFKEGIVSSNEMHGSYFPLQELGQVNTLMKSTSHQEREHFQHSGKFPLHLSRQCVPARQQRAVTMGGPCPSPLQLQRDSHGGDWGGFCVPMGPGPLSPPGKKMPLRHWGPGEDLCGLRSFLRHRAVSQLLASPPAELVCFWRTQHRMCCPLLDDRGVMSIQVLPGQGWGVGMGVEAGVGGRFPKTGLGHRANDMPQCLQ